MEESRSRPNLSPSPAGCRIAAVDRLLGRGIPVLASIAAIILAALGHGPVSAQQPVHRWTLSAGHVQQGQIDPTAGPFSLSLPDGFQISDQAPAAMVFSGAESQILVATDDLPAAELPTEQICVEAWGLIEQTTEWGGLCGAIQDNGEFERGWVLGYRDDRFCFGLSSTGRKRLTYLTAAAPFETGFWYHVVGCYDGKTMRLYVDGVPVAESTDQNGPVAAPPAGRLVLGGYVDDNESHPLSGQLHQVAIYDQSLSATQVQQLYARRRHLYPGIEPVRPQVVGWPTWQRDHLRSGMSELELAFPLRVRWVHEPRHPPAPAWPPPAENDFWNRKYNLKPRVVFDRAFHVVSQGRDRLYFGSSADCQVHCLDLKTGQELWTSFTDGPVRLAPTIAGDRLLFGSDDGCVYCLNRMTGEQLWKYGPLNSGRRQIAGNERIISALPIRTGILVEDDTVWLCAGLFPQQGVFQVALDLETGRERAKQPLTVTAQGYLERRAGRLFVPTGRDPAGRFAAELGRRHKDPIQAANRFAADYPYAFIGAKDVRIAGGAGMVAAFSVVDGQKIWSADVDGNAYGLAIDQECLLVSTDSGRIYCFESQQVEPAKIAENVVRPIDAPAAEVKADVVRRVTRLLNTTGKRQGYCLVLDSHRPELAIELARQSELRIVMLQGAAESLEATRRQIAAAGLYDRVCVQPLPAGRKLPFSDYLFNLVLVAPDQTGSTKAIRERWQDDVSRVLAPGRSVAVTGQQDQSLLSRPRLAQTGEWSHMYGDAANTCCSADERVHGRMQLQWFGEPGPRRMLNRHHRTVAPLWKDGRLFIPGNDQVFASDAYNGTLLWNKQILESRRIAAFRDCSYMAVGPQHLFVAAADHCLALNPETGYTEHTYRIPDDPQQRYDWGYVARMGRRLFGSATQKGAARREHTRESIMEAAYFDEREVVCSEQLFAFDTDTTGHEWTYAARGGAILNSTITLWNEGVYFVESRSAQTLKTGTGRFRPSLLMGNGADLVALSAADGSELWRVSVQLDAVQHNTYLAAAERRLAAVGTRNSGTDPKTARVVYEIRVFDAATGALAWQKTQQQDTEIEGDHGEQDLHPVIVDGRLYCEPAAYRLDNGDPIADWGWKLGKRRGCGNISASARSFFFRQSSPTMFDLQTRETQPVTTATRPGCLINILPAGGLLLIPEASSGCTCDYGVQTSLAFLPVVE